MVNSPFFMIVGRDDPRLHEFVFQTTPPDETTYPIPEAFLKDLRDALAARWADLTFKSKYDGASELFPIPLETVLGHQGVFYFLLFDAVWHGISSLDCEPFQGARKDLRWFVNPETELTGLALATEIATLDPNLWAEDLHRHLMTHVVKDPTGAFALDLIYEKWTFAIGQTGGLAISTNLKESHPHLFNGSGSGVAGPIFPQVPRLQVIPEGCPVKPRGFKKIARTLLEPLPLALWPGDAEVWATLRAEFPWASEVVEAVALRARFSQRVGQGVIRMPPLLLVGPVGCGKTRLAQRLGELLGLPHFMVSGAGADPSIVRGTEQQWSSGIPSPVARFMAEQRCPNPLVIVDEVDKQNLRHDHGTLQNALLPLLEPSSAKHIHDPYFEVPCDLSEVFWILTANDLADITGPLRSRVEILPMTHPRSEDLPVIVEMTRRSVAQRYRCDLDMLPWSFTDEGWVRRQLAQRFSVRDARRLVEQRLMQMPGPALEVVPGERPIAPPSAGGRARLGQVIRLADHRPEPQAPTVEPTSREQPEKH